MNTDDMDLLKRYATERSEAAFSELVSRHVNLVYSAALRQVENASLAEEVTQTVFIVLSQKAASISPQTILSGWLYRTVRFASSAATRREIRRQRREQEAHMQSVLNEPNENASWEQMSSQLDEAMAQLRDKDRDAIVLRYFENKSLQEVAVALGIEERAAQKRVSRSLEKLRGVFGRRGIKVSAVALAGIVSANAVQAAPVHLAATSAGLGTIASGGVASSVGLLDSTLKLMAWAKVKLAVLVTTSVVVTGMTAAVVMNNHKETESLDEKIARLSQPGTTTRKALSVLGEPTRYALGTNVFDRKNLPESYLLVYPQGVEVWSVKGKVKELRSLKPGPGFSYHRKLRLGSTIEEVLNEIGPPSETISGRPASNILGQNSTGGEPGVFYQDLNDEKGYGYYWRPDQNVRFLFKNGKVIALLVDVAN